MIKQPDSNLVKKLKAIEAKLGDESCDEAEVRFEHATALHNAWKQLTGEAKDVLDLLLATMEAQAVHNLQTPNVTDSMRAFTAGQLNVVYQIQGTMEEMITNAPQKEEYNSRFGEPDDVGPEPKIIY